MRFLAVTAGLDDGHDDVLRRHERQLLRDPARDDLGVDDEPLGHVLQRREHDVGGEERLGERDPPVRAARRSVPSRAGTRESGRTCRRACARTTARSRSCMRSGGGP